MTIQKTIPGLLVFLFSCSGNENSGSTIVSYDGTTIMTFDDFKRDDFRYEETFKLFQKAIAETKDQNFVSAKILLEEAMKVEPTNKFVVSSLGGAELNLGNYEEGIHHLENAYKLDSTYLEAYTNMAIGYNALEEYRRTIEVCDVAIRKTTRRKVLGAAYYNKAIAEYELKDIDKAISHIDLAIQYSDREEVTRILEETKAGWIGGKELVRVLQTDSASEDQ